ncbi:MAG: class I SAM-dependent methyltransferase [Euryarchaeota archaeon]|nr:class I SAM-dependent methyltransferase [Euryarchaeota archaeon]
MRPSSPVFAWPLGFPRTPREEWTTAPVEGLAKHYDTVERHGWYRNLDPSVDRLLAWLGDGHVLLDYSGGTGILLDRVFAHTPDTGFGTVIVDSSPKFLRLALEKFRDDPRVAFRLIRYLDDDKRLQYVDEVLEDPLLQRGVDCIASTNAIHLYYDLEMTLRSWHKVLRPGGRIHVQSGNIGYDEGAPSPGHWIIDSTVDAIARAAEEVVRDDERFTQYRAVLDDTERMAAHARIRAKYFLPVRPLGFYLNALKTTGFQIEKVERVPIEADVAEWLDFLSVYHAGILGWVGGTKRVEGKDAHDHAVKDRLEVIRLAADRVFDGDGSFLAEWTYIDGVREG